MLKLKRVVLLLFVFGGIVLFSYSFLQATPPNLTFDYSGGDELSTNYQFKTNKYTQQETDMRVAVNEFIDESEYLYLGHNMKNNLKLYVNQDDLSFLVLDQNTNYIWSSKVDTKYLQDPNSPLHEDGDIGASLFMLRRVKSPLVVSYFIGDSKRDEGLFDSAGSSFTYQELNGDEIGFSATIRFATSKISLKLVVYLDDNGLNIEVPQDSITEGENMKLSNISLYEYFGATKNNRIPGYVFVPDGIGALIRFDKDFFGPFNKRFYGSDFARAQSSIDEQPLFANLYGMVHGIDQNGFIAIIDKGSTYGNLVSVSSKTEDDFNRTFVSFEYRVLYTQFLNARKTSSVQMLQSNFNDIDIKITYQFLGGQSANYVGMAEKYRDYLELSNNQNSNNDISLHLNVLAAENRQTLFGKQSFSMTSLKELNNILDELKEIDILNTDVTYHGWTNIGFSNSSLRYKNINKKIGGKKALANLLADYGDNIYFSADYTHANANAKGYSTKDILMSIDQQYIRNENNKYLVKPASANKFLTSDYKKFNKLGIKNLDFLALSNELTSDFAKGGLNREETREALKELLEIAEKKAVAKPFSYLFDADVIYDVVLYTSNQLKFSDTVPFIPLVLGEKTIYGRAGNFFSNVDNEVLRMIDYNIYPSFYITHSKANLLLNTKSENIYTSQFVDWKDEIKAQYDYINAALRHVINAKISQRIILADGLVKNVYNNGVILYINYSNNTYTADGITILPVSYEVVK